MEIAGYSKISATANVYNVSCSDKKIYTVTYIGKYRIIGCMDSGSDLTIMHLSLFKRLNLKIKLDKENVPLITTFSNTGLQVCGSFHCILKFGIKHTGIPCAIYVIPDVPEQTQFLLGANLLKDGGENWATDMLMMYPIPFCYSQNLNLSHVTHIMSPLAKYTHVRVNLWKLTHLRR